MDIEQYRIKECPSSVFYIPSFLSEQEEESILCQIENTPKPRWTQLSNRRLINYGGVPHKNGMIAEKIPTWLSDKVDSVNNLGIFGNVRANHVLVNEYLPGQGIMAHFDGALFHPIICTISCGSHTILRFHENIERDKMIHNDKQNQISPTNVIQSTDYADPDHDNEKRKFVCQLLIERRSLLILKDDMYEKYLHSIDETSHDLITAHISNINYCHGFKDRCGEMVERDRRISLTIRHVPKTSKIHLRLGH